MVSKAMSGGAIRVAWIVIVIVLIVGLGVWGATIARSLTGTGEVASRPSPAPVTPVPTVVTFFGPVNDIDQAALCAQLAPRRSSVTVESTTGQILAQINC